MPWDMNKCLWGVPEDFTDQDAENAVEAADFRQSVYVNTSAKKGKTRQAYTYVVVQGYRVCVVGHIHPKRNGHPAIAGNAFIPGWQDWATETPGNALNIISDLTDGGVFPGDYRYPHPA